MKNLFAFILFSLFCVSCQSVPAIKITPIRKSEFENLAPKQIKTKSKKTSKTENAETEELKKASNEFRDVQLDLELPDPSDVTYYDAILPNNYFSFIGFQNKCEVYFDTSGIEAFTFYINDEKIETEIICAKEFCKVDVSKIVKNGRNILYLSNVLKNNPEAKLRVRIPYPVLTEGKKVAGVNYEALDLLEEILNAQIANGFPSAQLLIIKDGVIIKKSSYGKIYNDEKFGEKANKVTNRTLYDLASNTKIYATLFAVQRLVSKNKLSIHDKVCKFFPNFADSKNARYKGKADMTIEHLLTHSSGFPAGAAYYRKKGVKNAGKNERRKKTLEKILDTRLINNLGTAVVYSDINFMLLSFIVEKISGVPFEKFLEAEIYSPLKLNRICFKPLEKGFLLSEIASTLYKVDRSKENEKNLGFAHGRVHDPEAYNSMNEVSGHAGLFANAESLGVLAQTIINGGGYGNIKLFSKNTVNIFLGKSQYAPSYALGWRCQNNDVYKWAFSTFATPNTVGHTGWTGTLNLLDPTNNLIIILLTNSKHSPHVARQKCEGDFFMTRNYGIITSLIYSAFFNYDSEYFSSMLTELASRKLEQLEAEPKFDNQGFYADLNSLMQVIKRYSSNSPSLKKFLESEKAKTIKQILEEKLE